MKIQTKSKKVNKNWLHQHINDPYVQAAEKDGYRAAQPTSSKKLTRPLA